jgi:hypothetical protein
MDRKRLPTPLISSSTHPLYPPHCPQSIKRFLTPYSNYSVNKAYACNEATWKAPERTKDVIEAEAQYHQERKAFEALFEQARRICLMDP